MWQTINGVNHFVSVGPTLASEIEQKANDDPLKKIDNEPNTETHQG